MVVAVMTMINYALLTLFGYLRDFMRARRWESSKLKEEKENMLVCCVETVALADFTRFSLIFLLCRTSRPSTATSRASTHATCTCASVTAGTDPSVGVF